MILLQPPATTPLRANSRTVKAPRDLDVPLSGRGFTRLNPEGSVTAFRSFALQSHVHVDDITAEEALRLMLVFYRHVRTQDGRLEEEEGDTLHCEWGISECGGSDLFYFELSREFCEADSDDEGGVSRLTIGLHFKPTFTLRAIKSGHLWCPSREEADDFDYSLRSSDVFWAISTLPPAEVALEWNPV